MKTFLPISVTGHIDLLEEDKPLILKMVKELFETLRKKHNKNLCLYSGLAPGADTWTAECLNDQDKLIYLEVLREELFMKYSFKKGLRLNPPQRENFSCEDFYNLAIIEHTTALEKYTARVTSFEYFKKKYFKENDFMSESHGLDFTDEENRIEAYFLLGKQLVEKTDILIALWDGVDGGGVGGTSDVVNMWVKGRSQNGKRVNLKEQERTLYHLPVRRERNQFAISRNFEKI